MTTTRRVLLASVLLLGLAPAAFAQSGTPTRLRGTIDAVSADGLSLTTLKGEKLDVALTAKTGVSVVLPFNLADIKPGSYIGTAAVPGKGGVLVALEVHVFPDAMRGTGDGHRKFDLQPDSTMTNGTVGEVITTTGETLVVTYHDGKQTVLVPEGTPVVTLGPGDRTALQPGVRVIVFADKAADGKLTGLYVLAGKDGLAPPM